MKINYKVIRIIFTSVLLLSLLIIFVGCASYPLHRSIRDGNIKEANGWIRNKKGINDYDDVGDTPLHYAAYLGKIEIVESLLKAGANVNAKSKGEIGYTPLYSASSGGHTQIVQILLKNDADINAKTNNGTTCLMIASNKGYNDLCKVLIDNGADANAKNDEGMSPLQYAVRKNNFELTKLFIDNGVNIHDRSQSGITPLMRAAISGNYNIFKMLFEKGADINAKTNNGTTALMFASREGHVRIVQLLLYNGVDVNVTSKGPLYSALQYAAYNKKDTVVYLLIDRGAKFYGVTENEVTCHASAEAAKFYAEYYERKQKYRIAIKYYELAAENFSNASSQYEKRSNEISNKIIGNHALSVLSMALAGISAGTTGSGTYFVVNTSNLNEVKKIYDKKFKYCDSYSTACSDKAKLLTDISNKSQ